MRDRFDVWRLWRYDTSKQLEQAFVCCADGMDGGRGDLQANRAQDAQGKQAALGLDAFRRAWLDFKLALAGLHAAEENEAQVAHWVIEGMASFADLRAVREQVKAARAARSAARKRYIKLSALAAEMAGNAAVLRRLPPSRGVVRGAGHRSG